MMIFNPPYPMEENDPSVKETLSETVDRILGAPLSIDSDAELVFRFYSDTFLNRPVVWVVLEPKMPCWVASAVMQGREELGWRRSRTLFDAFTENRITRRLDNAHLMTEVEARALAASIGLDIDVAKRNTIEALTCAKRCVPNVVEEDIDLLLARRGTT